MLIFYFFFCQTILQFCISSKEGSIVEYLQWKLYKTAGLILIANQGRNQNQKHSNQIYSNSSANKLWPMHNHFNLRIHWTRVRFICTTVFLLVGKAQKDQDRGYRGLKRDYDSQPQHFFAGVCLGSTVRWPIAPLRAHFWHTHTHTNTQWGGLRISNTDSGLCYWGISPANNTLIGWTSPLVHWGG